MRQLKIEKSRLIVHYECPKHIKPNTSINVQKDGNNKCLIPFQ